MQNLLVTPSSAPTDLFDPLRNLNYLRISLVCKTAQAIALANSVVEMIQSPLGHEESESVAPMYNIPSIEAIEHSNSESSVKADGFFSG
jgi:hypothetical protein